MRDKMIFNFLLKFNLVVLVITTLLLFLSVFVSFKSSWAFLPIFPYVSMESEYPIVNLALKEYHLLFNIGFYIQFLMGVLAFMIYFAKKKLIAFQFFHFIAIMHSILALILSDLVYRDKLNKTNILEGQNYFDVLNWIYAIIFLVLFVANYFYDIKKASPDSYQKKPYTN